VEDYRTKMDREFRGWLGEARNVGEVQREVPEIDLRTNKGQLEFPTPRSVRWRLPLPEVTLGARKPEAEQSLKKLLETYLRVAGGQALEPGVPRNEQEALLRDLRSNPTVQIDDKPPAPQQPQQGTPSGQVASPQASGQSWVMSYGPAGGMPAWTQSDIDQEMGRGLESYWSGDTTSALQHFRTVTMVQPDKSAAWYYEALCELAMGDQIGADRSLRQAAQHEARTNATQEVSQALVRVQGPARNWLEAARRVALAENTRK
jgi:hypothetical protein